MERLRQRRVRRELSRAAGAALLAALAGCTPAGAVGAAPAAAYPAKDAFWWLHAGEQSAAVACFGRSFDTPDGRVRPWSLVVHLPGGTEPLSCTQGLLALGSADPIRAAGETFRVELRPLEGLLWSDVAEETQVSAVALGLH